MKILNKAEIKEFADTIYMTEKEEQEVADIFVKLKTNNEKWKITSELNSVKDYINEWETHWYRETNWDSFFEYEKNNFNEADNYFFETVEDLKNHVINSWAFELSNGMIIAVS